MKRPVITEIHPRSGWVEEKNSFIGKQVKFKNIERSGIKGYYLIYFIMPKSSDFPNARAIIIGKLSYIPKKWQKKLK